MLTAACVLYGIIIGSVVSLRKLYVRVYLAYAVFFLLNLSVTRFQGFSAAKSSVMSELQTVFTAQYIGIITVSVENFVLLRCYTPLTGS